MKKHVSRYHPLLVALHWVLAILTVFTWLAPLNVDFDASRTTIRRQR